MQIIYNRPLWNLWRTIFMSTNKDFVGKTQTWINSIRQDTHRQRNFIEILSSVRSDIKGNYGLLFGIKTEYVKPVNYDKTVERFETRTLKKIPLRAFTHIEVPLKDVEITKSFLKKKKIKLLVVPLDYGEIYFNRYRLWEMTN